MRARPLSLFEVTKAPLFLFSQQRPASNGFCLAIREDRERVSTAICMISTDHRTADAAKALLSAVGVSGMHGIRIVDLVAGTGKIDWAACR